MSFVLRLADGRYYAGVDKVPVTDPKDAQEFASRWIALGEASRAGSWLNESQIIPKPEGPHEPAV